MDILYKNLVDNYKTNIPEVKWIDLEHGQIDAFDKNYPVHFPAIFIDFENIQWKNVGRQVQVGDVNINLRIAFKIWSDTNNLTPDNIFNDSMNVLKLLNKIHKYTQAFSGEHFNRLDRISTTTKKRNDGLKVYNIKYKTNMRDAWAKPDNTQTQIEKLIIDVDVKTSI